MSGPISTKPPSGFRDFFGLEARRRAELVHKISKIYESFGFDPLETSAVENTQTLMGSGGGENEKLIFKILKRGDKLKEAIDTGASENSLADLGLRFDLTVPLARVVAEYQSQIKLPWKVYHTAPVWRAERAQKGRFREFIQCDVDIIGSSSLAAEAEVIQAVSEAASSIVGNEFELKLNDRRLIRSLAESFGFKNEKADAFAIILDKKDKVSFDELIKEWTELLGGNLPKEIKKLDGNEFKIDDFSQFNADATKDLKYLLDLLDQIDLPLKKISFDPSLARGLGYYTGAVFELRHHSAGYSLGGGGRYDHLIGRFLKSSIPAVGFSIGFERLLLLLEEKSASERKEIFIPIFAEDLRPQVVKLAKILRDSGIAVSVYPAEAKFKNQLKYAGDKNYRWVLILGEDEFKSSTAVLKDFTSGQESKISFKDLTEALTKL